MKKECRFCKYYYVRNYTPDGFHKCRARDVGEMSFLSKLPITAQDRGRWTARLNSIGLCYLDCDDCPLTSDYCLDSDQDETCKYFQKLLNTHSKSNKPTGESKMLKLEIKRDNQFYIEAITTIILSNENLSPQELEKRIEGWFDWLGSEDADKYFEDLFRIDGLYAIINYFFDIKGLTQDAVGKCINELYKAFGNISDELYERYNLNFLDIADDIYILPSKPEKFDGACIDTRDFLLENYNVKIDNFDLSYAIRAIDLFDEKFSWVTQYGYHAKWKIEFGITVWALCDLLKNKEQYGVSHEIALEHTYQEKAQIFLDKYFQFEE